MKYITIDYEANKNRDVLGKRCKNLSQVYFGSEEIVQFIFAKGPNQKLANCIVYLYMTSHIVKYAVSIRSVFR